MSPSQTQALLVDYEDGFKIVELAGRYSVSESTVQRVLARARVQQRANPLKVRKRYKPKPRKIKPCGTEAAYRRHKRKGEYPCTACLAAHVDYNREN